MFWERIIFFFQIPRETPIGLQDFPAEVGHWILKNAGFGLCPLPKTNFRLLKKGEKVQAMAFQGKIISDFSQESFATVSHKGQIQIRDQKGKVTTSFPFAEPHELKQVGILSSKEVWVLVQKKETGLLGLKKLDAKGKEIKQIDLRPTDAFWGNARFFLDEASNQMWVGYSSRSPHHAYAPLVEKFSIFGEERASYQWDERGFFFDGCVNSQGNFLLARDRPTSPYTVPDYSFLEKVTHAPTNGIQGERLLELETNRLIDSLGCSSQGLYMATHSIFGSEPKQVLHWSEDSHHAPKPLVQLPSRALKILLCEAN